MGALKTLAPGVLTIGAYSAFAPVAWAENGAAHGKDIHFLRAFAREAGLAVDVRFFEFDRLWERPLRQEVDIAAGGIAPSHRRCAPGLAWSSPYHTVQRSLVVRKEDAAQLQTMADFGGRIIAVTRGSTAHLDAERRKPETAQIVYFESQEHAIQDLFRGRIDAFGTGDICGHHVAAQHADRLAVSDVHETDTPEHFAFAMEETSHLLAPLNTFIRKNGERYPTVPPTCEWSDYQI
jgi:polar amino acid transport system substrate-binding protein